MLSLEGTHIDENGEYLFVVYLTAVLYALRSSYHQSHGHLPTQLVFGRDMFSPVSTDIDWNSIRVNKQTQINKSNTRENSKQIPHTFSRGNYIIPKKPGILQKLAIPREGPYKVMKHNNDGSILIEKVPTNMKNISVQRVVPYYHKTKVPTMNRS